MQILILGSDGQLGSALTTELEKNSSNYILRPNLDEVDFLSPSSLENYLEKIKGVELIINCAAMTDTNKCEDFPEQARAINAYPLEIIAQFANKQNIPIIHFSTDYIFNGKKKSPYTENDNPSPLNEYGHSKLLGETNIIVNHNQYYIFRISSLYGLKKATGKGSNLIYNIINLLNSNKEIKMVNDQFITPTNVDDIVLLITKIVNGAPLDFGIYHFSCEGSCTYYELSKEISKYYNNNTKIIPVSMTSFPSKIQRPQNGALSIDKIADYYKPAHWKDSLNIFLKKLNCE